MQPLQGKHQSSQRHDLDVQSFLVLSLKEVFDLKFPRHVVY